MEIGTLDLTVIIAYLVGIVALGLYASRKEKNTTSDYFLAGRSLGWPMVGMALFATNISTVHLVGLASSAYEKGAAVGNFEWLAASCLILLGVVFAPFYFRSGVTTLPEYLERRYSPSSRMVVAVMGVAGALFIHIGVSLYAGAKIIEHFLGLPPMVSIATVSVATAIYTVVGGLLAVVITEALQTVLLLLGSVIITYFGIVALGDQGITTFAQLKEAARPDQLSMIRTEGDYTWYAMLLGYPVIGIWYWCADQTIVQRVLGAKTERDAQLGPIFAGFIKILPVFLMVFPGVMAYVLFQDTIGEDKDSALPVLIEQLVPTGLKGLLAAGLLAALMSTVAGALNSASTLVSIDLVKRLRPQTTETQLVRIGQVTAVVVMLAAVAWSTQGEHFGGIFEGLNHMIVCLAPPITTVFIMGVFWRRGTSQAAFCTLVVGFGLGIATFIADFPAIGFKLITEKLEIPFMLQAWWLFVICCSLFIVVSLLTPRPANEKVDGLCWPRPWSALTGPMDRLTDPRGLAALLLITMAGLYWIFA